MSILSILFIYKCRTVYSISTMRERMRLYFECMSMLRYPEKGIRCIPIKVQEATVTVELC